MKRCVHCGETKPLDCFHKDRAAKDGHGVWCHPCRSAREHERYERDKNRILDNAKKRRTDPREAEANRARSRDWYKRNPTRAYENNRSWRRRHPNWNKSPQARMLSRQNSARRRAQKRATAIPESVDFLSIYRRAGGRCWICWRSLRMEEVHFDHVIPLVKGGLHVEANLRVACGSCNDRKGSKIPTPPLIASIHDASLAAADLQGG